MKTINTRQNRILRLIETANTIDFNYLERKISGVAKITLKRDLIYLQKPNILLHS